MRTGEGSRCYSGFDTRLNYVDIVVIARIVTPIEFTSGQHGYWNQSNKLYTWRWVARFFEFIPSLRHASKKINMAKVVKIQIVSSYINVHIYNCDYIIII